MAEPNFTLALAQLYESVPLPAESGSIRLLDIEASDPLQEGGGPLRGNFRIIDLFARPAPDFTALSYVWGEIKDAAPTSRIFLGADSVTLQLTENCFKALHSLRSSTGSLKIWVDAICINQGDIIEKAHQINLMGDIYSGADKTYIWLGLEDESKTRAIGCLSNIGALEYFFSTPQQGPGAAIRPRPWSAAWALYCCRWKHIKHGLKLSSNVDGLNCSECKQGNQNAFMTSSRVAHASVVSVSDLVRFLDNPWLYRVWTYQEVMLSENPVLVCGTTMMPWWRFSMSVLYLRITEHWADKHDPHKGDRTSDLFKSLRLWRALVLDRNKLHMSKRHIFRSSNFTTLHLQLYNRFLSDIADVFMFEYLSKWRVEFLLLQLLLSIAPFGFAIGWALSIWTEDSGFNMSNSLGIASGIAFSVFNCSMYVLSRNLDHTVRRPRRKFLRHNPATWPEESSAENIILSAIWGRQCKENKDFNFGTRNIIRALIGAELPHLNYSSPVGEVYRDLTANVLHLTRSSELILAALRSQIPGAPSWTVDWSMRKPLRLYRYSVEHDHGLFYDLTADPMPPDSVMFDPSHPNVLQIRGWNLGAVKAVLSFKTLQNSSQSDQRAEHIHNLTALLQLANAELDHNDWEAVEMHLPELTAPTLAFLRRNRHMQPEEMLSTLQSSGRFHIASFWKWCGFMSDPLYATLFESYKSFCNAMAAKQDRRIVIVDGARPLGSDISASHWPSNVCMATCYPVPSPSYPGSASSAAGYDGLNAQFQECRLRPGDAVLQLCSMIEKAVVRQEDNKLVFVDAIEAMGMPIVVEGWTKAYNISEMPLVDIDRYTQTPPALPPPQPRRQDPSSHLTSFRSLYSLMAANLIAMIYTGFFTFYDNPLRILFEGPQSISEHIYIFLKFSFMPISIVFFIWDCKKRLEELRPVACVPDK